MIINGNLKIIFSILLQIKKQVDVWELINHMEKKLP